MDRPEIQTRKLAPEFRSAARRAIKKTPIPYEGTGEGPRYHPSSTNLAGTPAKSWLLSGLFNGVIRRALLLRIHRSHQAGRSRASSRRFCHRLAPTADSLLQAIATTPAHSGIRIRNANSRLPHCQRSFGGHFCLVPGIDSVRQWEPCVIRKTPSAWHTRSRPAPMAGAYRRRPR